mgnify:CR=1 FL=1
MTASQLPTSAETSTPEPTRRGDPVDAALRYLASRQEPSGQWKGDYGGPLFLLPIYVSGSYIMNQLPEPHVREEMVRYIKNHQNPDGGWGLHVEGHSHVFTSVLNYVTLRLLGVPSSDSALSRARAWFLPFGGAKASASWGKFTLALLDLYDYEGLHPQPPELWLLPESLPIHPSRLWCHCRMVYLPMAWLYGRRARAQLDPLLASIRTEIYDEPYADIKWRRLRSHVAPTDLYTPHSQVMRLAYRALAVYEDRHNSRLRQAALDFVLDQVRQEDENTNYLCIGPINKVFNALCWHFEKPGGPEVTRHLERLPEYLWQADDGTKMQGYNSSELWDTAFAVQAVLATGKHAENRDVLQKAHAFIEQNQVLEDTPQYERYYRTPSKGGWPFSTRDHGWPITDCTSEGLKCSLQLADVVDTPIPKQRLLDAVDLILWFQNDDGGWASYERTRGPRWLELLNPAEVFGDIMIDYSYVECSAASMQALKKFQKHYPGERDAQIDLALARGKDFILSIQRDDGSWYGSWGICFTYGTWFGIEGLKAAGLPDNHPAIRKACAFLESKQLPDGGWGETPGSCYHRRYVHAEHGQAVMTAWAILALVAAGRRDSGTARRGVEFLEGRQNADGSFPAEHIAGVFNRTCAIHYDNYLKVFPLWALAAAR